MKKPITLLAYLMLILLIYSCDSEPPILNFLVNSRNYEASEQEPTDSLKYYVTYTGFKLSLRDVSEPAKKVKSRTWYINEKEQEDQEQYVTHTMEEAGMYRIKLCVNGTEHCLSKWVKVIGEPEPESDPSNSIPQPIIDLMSPPSNYESTKNRTYDLSARVSHVDNKESIELLVNDGSEAFDFNPETGELTAIIRLKEGDNAVEIKINTAEHLVTELLTIERERKRRDDDENTGPLPPPPPKSLIKFVEPTTKNSTTEENTQIIRFRTENIIGGKKVIKVLVNGERQDNENLQRDNEQKEWTMEIPLRIGPNTVELQANKASDEVIINSTATPPLPNLGTAAAKSESYKDCGKGVGNSYTFRVTPKQHIEILSFLLFADQCGGIKVKVQGPEGQDEMNTILLRGKNQISFDMGTVMRPGLTYTITCTTYSGHPSCDATVTPALLDASACTPAPAQHPNTAFTLDKAGKNILFDLKYLY